ncbi:MAG TPA: hypothetical protein VJN22_00445 [Candidatus Eremiobacteraceae bacterium]|nr:hypothetical protein [Candidatus Eremiobacteraceae bacterium]
MKLARFWSRAKVDTPAPKGPPIRVVARGWSNDSLDAAAAKAREIAAQIGRILADGKTRPGRYPYGDRPIPEPVIREFPDGAEPRAVVTRNVYGALVLNTRDLMFIDIDDAPKPLQAARLLAGVMSLFGKKSQPAPLDPLVAISRIAADSGLLIRTYKTAGGYRAIVLNATFNASSDDSAVIMRVFDADPLYMRLCKQQESFRARLTPKPWRIALAAPPVAFPFETPEAEARFGEWQGEYEKASARFATCRFISQDGDGTQASGFDDIISYHDAETKATSGLPLA